MLEPYNLALCYENGRGVEQNYQEDVRWYNQAAEQKHADARVALSRITSRIKSGDH